MSRLSDYCEALDALAGMTAGDAMALCEARTVGRAYLPSRAELALLRACCEGARSRLARDYSDLEPAELEGVRGRLDAWIAELDRMLMLTDMERDPARRRY